MRRVAVLTGAWLLAAAVAVAVAWQGVGIVTRNVTDDRPASLTAGEVRELAAEAAGTTTTSAVTPSSSPAATPTSAPGTVTTSATRPSATSVSPPATATATSAQPAATSTTTSATSAETRTYNVVGGSVALRFAPEGVTVVWATPNDGFEVEVEPENVNGVRVEFESESHRSRVDGWWDGGPQDRVREESDAD